MEEKVDITRKYEHEIMNINNKLNQLEKGRIYEITNAKMDGYLSTNIEKLRDMIEDLLYKIEYSEKSMDEKISREFKKLSN